MSTVGDNEIYESCCDQRTACIQTCGAIKTVCDEEFQKCTKQVCSAADNEEQCNNNASIFSIVINLETCQTYEAEQYSRCDCVASQDAPGRREDLLKKFYQKFSPESVEKARDLAKKADTTRKMATLVGKLVKKYYPKTIKKIEDPNQKVMEMMKKKMDTEEVQDNGEDEDEGDSEEEDIEEL
eukprot:CAMPEP_0172372596 /NCGR_PEP_ID=MMETSP1060-20121228/48391_1 /TAXON_ID=37318 /ORGANISM="Pseudo-nitzschia pungens, Strain cf. cingulata" /LENGTH=182 /DNA_ID=CAMNT_0013098667 /DNA_START=321 /DNA_END=869 /DNA_ORIENTATION=+